MLSKKVYLTISLCIITLTVGLSQNLDFKFRYGFATNRLKSFYSSDQKGQLMDLKGVSDLTFVVDYKIPLKFKTSYFLGLEFGHTSGYLPLIGWGADSRLLENLVYNKQRISLRWLGIEKRFNLIDQKLWISANIVLLSRFYLGNEKRYSSGFKTNNEEWIEYQYDLRTYHNKIFETNPQHNFFDQYVNTEYGLQLVGKIGDKLNWNFNLTYYRNLYNYYNFELDIIYNKILIMDGVETPYTEIYDNTWYQSFNDEKLIQREHYFALGFGLSYKF